MSRSCFDKLVNAIVDHLRGRGRLQRVRTNLHLCFMQGFWILMNMDTFKNTALHFNTSPGVIFYHYVYLIQSLREMVHKYVQWPTRQEREEIKLRFHQIGGYHGVVGAIDGVHIHLTAPLEEKQAYVNRHHSHSILAQVVCDHNLLIRDLYVGEPGSLHDSRMFRRSPLCTNLLEEPRNYMEPDEHIVGDGGYILTDKVLIPYDDNGALNEVQTHHNKALSAVRSHVERSFCFVKMYFPRLKYFRSLRMEYAVDHAVSCFVLHNFIILAGEELPPNLFRGPPAAAEHNIDPDDHVDADEMDRGHGYFPNVAVDLNHPLLLEATIRGQEKRERMAARLFLD